MGGLFFNGRWGLWINLFYRNRVSRSACGSGYNFPISVPSSSFKKRVQGDSSFRVRSSCLILAFCRRGMTLLIFGDLLVGWYLNIVKFLFNNLYFLFFV